MAQALEKIDNARNERGNNMAIRLLVVIQLRKIQHLCRER
jgi:hypothetical protein